MASSAVNQHCNYCGVDSDIWSNYYEIDSFNLVVHFEHCIIELMIYESAVIYESPNKGLPCFLFFFNI